MSGAEKYKLTREEIEAIQADTETSHCALGRKYKVDHTTIMYHRKMVGVKLKMRVARPQLTSKQRAELPIFENKPRTLKCSFCGKIFKRAGRTFEKYFCSKICNKKFHNDKSIPKTQQEEDYNYYVELEKNRKIKRDSVGNIIK